MQYETLIQQIGEGGAAHDKALSKLYSDKSLRTPVIKFLKSKGMSKDTAQTIWTDTMVQFGKLVQQGKYEHKNSLVGYLMNLSRYLMLNHISSSKKHQYIELYAEADKVEASEEVTLYGRELSALIDEVLGHLGESCRQILALWSRGYSMAEIGKKMKIISNEATRKRKHSCLKKLLHNVEADPALRSQLKQYLID